MPIRLRMPRSRRAPSPTSCPDPRDTAVLPRRATFVGGAVVPTDGGSSWLNRTRAAAIARDWGPVPSLRLTASRYWSSSCSRTGTTVPVDFLFWSFTWPLWLSSSSRPSSARSCGSASVSCVVTDDAKSAARTAGVRQLPAEFTRRVLDRALRTARCGCTERAVLDIRPIRTRDHRHTT